MLKATFKRLFAAAEKDMEAAYAAGVERGKRDAAYDGIKTTPIAANLLEIADAFHDARVRAGERDIPIDQTCIEAAAMIAAQARRIRELEAASASGET